MGGWPLQGSSLYIPNGVPMPGNPPALGDDPAAAAGGAPPHGGLGNVPDAAQAMQTDPQGAGGMADDPSVLPGVARGALAAWPGARLYADGICLMTCSLRRLGDASSHAANEEYAGGGGQPGGGGGGGGGGGTSGECPEYKEDIARAEGRPGAVVIAT
jgi:hypothetical protein